MKQKRTSGSTKSRPQTLRDEKAVRPAGTPAPVSKNKQKNEQARAGAGAPATPTTRTARGNAKGAALGDAKRGPAPGGKTGTKQTAKQDAGPRATKSGAAKAAPKREPKGKGASPQGSPNRPVDTAPRPAFLGPKRKKATFDDDTGRCGTVALVGRPNVGKSTLLNALTGEKLAATTHKPQTTRRTLRAVVTEGPVQLVFVDTPGLHTPQKGLHRFMVEEALEAARTTDVVAFIVEATRDGTIDRHDELALKQLTQAGVTAKFLLVINKIDMLKDKASLLPLLQRWHDTERFEALIPVSAKNADGLHVLIHELGKRLPEGPQLFDKDALTDASERDICAELIREKCMLELQDEVPYRLAVVIEHFDEARREDDRKPLVHIAAQIIVESDSQKPLVIGKGGQRIKTIGSRAREELQRLLDCQVMLELFVKVEPDWTLTEQGMRKVGYVR